MGAPPRGNRAPSRSLTGCPPGARTRNPARARRPRPGPDLSLLLSWEGAQVPWTVVAPGPCPPEWALRVCAVLRGPPQSRGSTAGPEGPRPAAHSRCCRLQPLTSVLATPAVTWGGRRRPRRGSQDRGGVGARAQEGATAARLWPSTAGPAPVLTCLRGRSVVAGRSHRERLTWEHSSWGLFGPPSCSTYRGGT